MKQNNSNLDQFNDLVMVPKNLLQEVRDGQKKLMELLTKNTKSQSHVNNEPDKLVSEVEAKKLLGRETTWFWQKRKSGELKYRKMGNKNYYRLSDIEKLFVEPTESIDDER